MTDSIDPHLAVAHRSTGGGDQKASHHGGEEADALGPIDPLAWWAGALGVLLGLVVAFCFILATSGI